MNVDPSGHIFFLCLLLGIGIGVTVGATVAGVKASQAGLTGWDLVGAIFMGGLIGGAFGGLAGAFVGGGIALIGSGLSMLGGVGGLSLALASGGTMATIAVGGAIAIGAGAIAIGSAGAIAGIGLSILFAEWKPYQWPGDDPTVPPGDGFEWRGPGAKGSDKGAWYNPFTKDSLHPDLNHPAGIPPHWDWINKVLKICLRIFK